MHESLKPLQELKALRDPVLIAAFTGWGDMGGSAAATIEYLTQHWNTEPIAEVESEHFFDFTVQRPHVRLENGQRVIDWPNVRFYHARPPGTDRDFVLLSGVEPSLRWRAFTEAVADLMRIVETNVSITIGAQPAAVPHTRPLPISLSASEPEFEDLFDLKSPESRYEGATGIIGVINLHHRSLKWRNASLWALAPHYLTMGPNPNVVEALVKKLDHGFNTNTPLEPLDDRLSDFSQQVAEALGSSSEAATYVRQLEEQYDAEASTGDTLGDNTTDDEDIELPPTENLLEDLDQFLRGQR